VTAGSLLVGLTQQRGAVKGAVPAWILAVGGMPAIGFLLTALALVSGAWLTWGKTRAP
jgi:hypothetical protein